eukprot:8455325-Ditylum_brightwellii.AAC.1
MKWEDDSEAWEPLGIDGWDRLYHYVKNEKKFKCQMKQVKINSMRHGPMIKFGVRNSKDHHEALELDRKLGNTLWREATKAEMDKTYEYEVFKSLGKGGRKPKDHVMICVHLAYDVK